MNEVTTETDAGTITEDNLERAAQAFPAQDVATVERGQSLTAIPEGPGALLAATLQLARDPNFDPAKLQMMLDMQYRLEDRQAERDFAAALSAAQSEVPQVSRLGIVDLNKKGDRPDPKNKYNFARLEDIDTVLRPIMTAHGFSIHFDRVQREGGGLVVTGTLSHKGGACRTASFPLPLDKGPGRNDLQSLGSTDSYARRYLIEGFFHIVRKGKDDDGNTADPLLNEEIEDLLELLSRTRTAIVPFLYTMVGEDFDLGTDPDHPDPISLLAQVQRKEFNRLHKVLVAKQAQQAKKKSTEGDAQ